MTTHSSALALTLAALLTMGAGWAAADDAAHPDSVKGAASMQAGEAAGHSHDRCELHGGQVTMTKAHHFETVFTPQGVQVYVYGADQSPLEVEKAKATVVLQRKDASSKELPMTWKTPKMGEKAVYYCPMQGEEIRMAPGKCPKCGMFLVPMGGLVLSADLSKIPPGTLKALVRITGLGGSEPQVTFTEAYAGEKPTSRSGEKDSPEKGSEKKPASGERETPGH